jgi:hypothetical protein
VRISSGEEASGREERGQEGEGAGGAEEGVLLEPIFEVGLGCFCGLSWVRGGDCWWLVLRALAGVGFREPALKEREGVGRGTKRVKVRLRPEY